MLLTSASLTQAKVATRFGLTGAALHAARLEIRIRGRAHRFEAPPPPGTLLLYTVVHEQPWPAR